MNLVQRLKEVLFLLASPADIQISSFPEFVDVPDEIVMETGDAIELASLNANDINSSDLRILEALKQIDDLFSTVGHGSDVWTVEGIRTSHIWKHARIMAKESIDQLQLNYNTPNLFWLSFFPVEH